MRALDRRPDGGLPVAFDREQAVALAQPLDLRSSRTVPRAERRRQQDRDDRRRGGLRERHVLS
ncbi:MAG TPA: hypothetical protein VNS09_03470 [Solirubrobacter sp.]|nr:hypothetical protein [Solirubrobacter sp.]